MPILCLHLTRCDEKITGSLRLQGELQKSRDTGSNLNDVNSTLCDVHDTLGGSVPRPSSTAQTNGGPLPYPTTSSFPPRPQAQASNESIQALQQQLNDLASHVGRIRDLEGMLKEQEGVREEVENLRRLMEENGRKEENERELEREHERNGRESPVARMLEREEQEEEDDEDARSIASIDTIVDEQTSATKKKQTNGDVASPLESDETTSEPTSAPSTVSSDELARERLVLQEQNAALTARLDALSAELDEAIQLGRSLQTQHSEAFSTIKVLEEKIASLETAVEEKVELAQGKVMRECEERWKGWKEVFEEGWRREKEGWREEREKLWQVVKDWEERKKNVEVDESGDVESEGSDEEDDDEEGDLGPSSTSQSAANPSSSSSPRSPSPKKRAARRRKRSTIVPNPSNSSSSSSSTNSIPSISRNLTSSLAPENLASDSDSTIGAGETGSTVGEGKVNLTGEGGDSGSRSSGVRGSSRTPVCFPLLFRYLFRDFD